MLTGHETVVGAFRLSGHRGGKAGMSWTPRDYGHVPYCSECGEPVKWNRVTYERWCSLCALLDPDTGLSAPYTLYIWNERPQ